MQSTSVLSQNIDQTYAFGKKLSKNFLPGSVLAFYGELGAGKTSLIKGIANGLGMAKEEVTSPTFTLMQHYPTSIPLFHFDLYRLKSEKEFLELGFEEYFFQGGICLIEWAEKISSLLPKSSMIVKIVPIDKNSREIEVSRI